MGKAIFTAVSSVGEDFNRIVWVRFRRDRLTGRLLKSHHQSDKDPHQLKWSRHHNIPLNGGGSAVFSLLFENLFPPVGAELFFNIFTDQFPDHL